VAAIAPVAIRAINPNDKAFGVLPDAAEVEKALKTAKAPVKKKAAKKPVKK
jgi:hypothetical protein